jgi:hypothetical protein
MRGMCLGECPDGLVGGVGDLAICAVPTGLRISMGCGFPTLKRGANGRCAYGAGAWRDAAIRNRPIERRTRTSWWEASGI